MSADVREAMFPATAVFEDGRLRAIGGMDVEELAARFETPVYVLDRAELVGRMRAYRAAFGPAVAVTYAAKALCVVGVLQLAAREGLHVDVSSGGELHTALRAGVPMDRVIFHGNNKSRGELEQAAGAGVARIMVDSFFELALLEQVGARMGHTFDVVLRVTPGVEAHTHEFVRTGHDDSKFGFTLSAGFAHEAVARALALPHVRLRGLHCHVGSQIFRPEAFEAAAEIMVGLLADVRERFGVVLEELNLGGGLGVAYVDAHDPPPLGEYAGRLLAAVASSVERRDLPPPRLAVEPGRWIVAPAGITLYRVGTVKEIPGVRTYASVDGGMSDNIRPALYGAAYTFAAAGPPRAAAGAQNVYTVVGKHCESGDVLGRNVALPRLVEGDLLAVAGTGAYTHSMASNYNRLPRPAMVLVGEGHAHVLVRRETLDDVISHDEPLPL